MTTPGTVTTTAPTDLAESTALPAPSGDAHGREHRSRLGTSGVFWTAAAAIALCLWSSGSPALLYPTYARMWGLTPTDVTVVFAVYPVTLLVMLLLFGSVSDRIGRRRALLAGIIVLLTAALAFAVAPGPWLLYVGRALQGVGTGLVVSSATAAITERNTGRPPQRVGTLVALANGAGLAASTLIPVVLITGAPLPRQLSFLVLAGLVAVVGALVLLMPDDRPRRITAVRTAREASLTERLRGWRPAPVGVPRALRGPFVVAALALSGSFAVGALLLSLGSQLVVDVVHPATVLPVGLLLSVVPLVIGLTAVSVRDRPAHQVTALGGSSAAAGVLLLLAATHAQSLTVFLVSAVLSGIGFGASLSGGVRLLAGRAPAHHRAQVLSALYLCAYATQGVAAVAVGLTATRWGLAVAVDAFAPVVAVVGLAAAVASLRPTHPVPA